MYLADLLANWCKLVPDIQLFKLKAANDTIVSLDVVNDRIRGNLGPIVFPVSRF